ncbi:hypothetical protein FisN_23Lh089 [Fistulifera solaris]|uniref:HMG box domain-containing protein n=1 Tax=Fistulifera solaris TaxID=1519565 RepID=A0A1Z5KM30_FISSO|nr:hypothetical protein FisN_23Lh089 [Fistulifera solaris]|eukprot:GAX27336.1 hypothetical protein FisN_23Lh089 [Fistulifera solaris]
MASSQYNFDDVDYQYGDETGGFTNDGRQFDNTHRQLEEGRQLTQPNDNSLQLYNQGTMQAFQEMQRQRAANAFQPQMSSQFQSAVQNFSLGYVNAPTVMGMAFDQTQKNSVGMTPLTTQFQQQNLFYGNLAAAEQQQNMFLAQQTFNQINPLWMATQTNQGQNSGLAQGMAMNNTYGLAGNNFMGEFAEQMATSYNIPNEQGAGDLSFQRLLHRNISGLVKGVTERQGQPVSFNDDIFARGASQSATKELKPPFLIYPQDNQIESRGILLTKPSDEPDDLPSIARPKRPLTAYNLFFKEERANIVQEQAAENEHHTSDGVKRNRRKEPHGKIGFEDMAKTIAERWKTIDPERLAAYNQRADEGKKQYRKAITEFNRKRKAAQKKRQQEMNS